MQLNASQMLAVPAALSSQRVVILTFNANHSRHLIDVAKSSIPRDYIQQVGGSFISFPSGGRLEFVSMRANRVQESLRGHNGPVYVLSATEDGDDVWELCTTYVRGSSKRVTPEKVKPRTRFERILDDDD